MPDIGLLGGPPRPRVVPVPAAPLAEEGAPAALASAESAVVAAQFLAPVVEAPIAVVSAPIVSAGAPPVRAAVAEAGAEAAPAPIVETATVSAPVTIQAAAPPNAAVSQSAAGSENVRGAAKPGGSSEPAGSGEPFAPPQPLRAILAPIRWRDLLWLALALCVVVGTGLGIRDPWPADEPRFAVVARDMVATGEWLFPRVGGDLYQDKPPFFFWLLAVCYTLIGSIKWSFLLPAFCAAGGVLFLVYDFGRRLVSREAGFASALVLCFTLQFVMVFRGAQIDPVLCFITTLSLYALLRHLLLGPAWGWYFVGGFAAGVGIFTKGVGFLPVLLLIPFFLMRGFRWQGLAAIDAGKGGWRWWLAPLAMLAAVSLWFVPMLLAVAASGSAEYVAYRDELMFKQTVGRYAASWHHVKSWYYFIVEVIPPLWLPFSLLLFWLVPRFKAAYRARDARVWLPLSWLILVVVFFSLSPGKRGVYITPALPALAIAALPFIESVLARTGVRRAGLVLGSMFFVAAAAFAIACAMHVPLAAETLAAARLDGPDAVYVYLSLCGTGLVYAFVRAPLAAWPVAIGSLAVAFSYFIAPSMNGERSGKDFIRSVLEQVRPGEELGMVAYKEQFLLYLDRPVVNFGHRRVFEGPQESYDAAAWLNEAQGRVLLVPLRPGAETASCFIGSVERAGTSSGDEWFLVRAPASPACAQKGSAQRAIRYVITEH